MEKRILILAILSIFLLSACACGEGKESDFLPILDREFCLTLSGTLEGVEAVAMVRADAPIEGAEGRVRAVSVVFSEPAALRGVEVSCEAFDMDTHALGALTVTAGELVMEEASLVGFLTPVLLLAAEFQVTDVLTEKQDGIKVTVIHAESRGNRRTVTIRDGRIVAVEGQFSHLFGKWTVG